MRARLIAVALLIALALPLGGCSRKAVLWTTGLAAAAAVGTGGYLYARGDLEHDLARDHKAVYEAAVRTLNDKGYRLRRQEITAINAVLEADGRPAGLAEDVKVTIKLRKVESGDTHISIRFGLLGDEALSRDMLAAIEANLARSA